MALFSGAKNLPVSRKGVPRSGPFGKLHVFAYIDLQGGLRSWPLYKMVGHLLIWV